MFDVFPGSDDCRHKFALLSHVYMFRVRLFVGKGCFAMGPIIVVWLSMMIAVS